MNILALKPGHDGTIALVTNAHIEFVLEAEKDSFPRYSGITPSLVLQALATTEEIPNAICVSGWVKGFHSIEPALEAGYYGWNTDGILVRSTRLLGRDVTFFSSTHERSHLLCCYGMAPLEQGEPCYVLIWEGNIGKFYEVDKHVRISCIADVLEDPGNKYSHLFALADPTFPNDQGHFRFENAGKMMALAGYGQPGPLSKDEQDIVDFVLSRESIILSTPKAAMTWSPYHNIGVESQAFKDLARKFTDAIFDVFLQVAQAKLTKDYPLLIAGGCGLNCEWNSRWRDCGLFPEVFIPPVTNDTGSAIGTAIDAQRHLTGCAKVTWDPYRGTEFIEDVTPPAQFSSLPLNFEHVALLLHNEHILAWVQGRYEMGPRALGNRSILAAPFKSTMQARLNCIKDRESYRPVAPVCLEEDVDVHFSWKGSSPYMLYFQRVLNNRLAAVTHVDGSARVQTVTASANAPLHALLMAFKRVTGVGVLCNTSLNFKGRGFINRMSDLVEFTLTKNLDGFVVGNVLYQRRRAEAGRGND